MTSEDNDTLWGDSTPTKPSAQEKNPAAVALGRLGGLKGGPARAKLLTAERRREIAKKAIETRWRNKVSDNLDTGD